MGLSSRSKGKRLEREVVEMVRRDLGGADARRNLQQPDEGGADLLVSLPLVIEVAGGKCPSPIGKLRQAQRGAILAKLRGRVPGHTIPCAVVRRDREEWTVTVSWHDAVRMFRAWLTMHGRMNENETMNETGDETC